MDDMCVRSHQTCIWTVSSRWPINSLTGKSTESVYATLETHQHDRFNFSLECESSERLLFLFLKKKIGTVATR